MTSLPSIKILIVDDLDENILALEALLRREGLEFLKARSGPEALELLLVHDVALALLDVQMPEMDGFELAELMRGAERTRSVPLIFLTAGSHDARRVFRGYEVGAVDFLYKPIDAVLLGHKVATFVELHRQRLERERLNDELREMLRLNELFVAALSHDLRSPLSTAIMGMMMLERDISDPAAKRTLARMRSGADRMVAMLEQLYDLSRARLGGGIAIDPHETDFRVVTDAVVDELRIAYPERSVAVEYEGGSTHGVWDAPRLAQIITNLVGNALRYGLADVAVRVNVRGEPGTVSLEVHNGGQIADAVRPHLFDPFRRGPRPARDSLGLGLYIVRQLVLAHGGTIDARSGEGGTTFRIELPRTARVGSR